jgi:DNA-binding response OmpR family regulator
MLRRMDKLSGQAASPVDVIRIGDVELDRNGRLLLVNNKRVMLTRSEFDILTTLMSAPNRVFSRQDLMEQSQGTAIESYDRSIDVHIHNLRLKLEPNPNQSTYIETVYGMGYRFNQQ